MIFLFKFRLLHSLHHIAACSLQLLQNASKLSVQTIAQPAPHRCMFLAIASECKQTICANYCTACTTSLHVPCSCFRMQANQLCKLLNSLHHIAACSLQLLQNASKLSLCFRSFRNATIMS